MSWQEVPIGTVCDLVNGRAFKPTDWTRDGLPIVRIQNLNNEDAPFNRFSGVVRDRFLIDSGELLFSWSGTPGTSFGAFFWHRGPAVLNQHIFRVLLRDGIDANYFRHALNARLDRIIAQAHGGVGLQHITKGKLETTTVPLTSLREQRRIAAILDKADAIRRKPNEAIKLTEELLRSVFLELFGDPVTNPKGWPTATLADVLENIDSGWSPVCDSRSAKPSEWGVLKLGAVTYCEYDDTENKALLPDVTPRPELEVAPGDVLFARKNTYDLVGACAYVHTTRPRLMLPDLIFRLRIRDQSKVSPLYLWRVLAHPTQRTMVQRLAGGTAGSMPNISKGRLNTVEIPLPPATHQERFSRFVSHLRTTSHAFEAARAEANALFGALRHRAFRGEL